jgi:hypothetical protein
MFSNIRSSCETLYSGTRPEPGFYTTSIIATNKPGKPGRFQNPVGVQTLAATKLVFEKAA